MSIHKIKRGKKIHLPINLSVIDSRCQNWQQRVLWQIGWNHLGWGIPSGPTLSDLTAEEMVAACENRPPILAIRGNLSINDYTERVNWLRSSGFQVEERNK